MCSAIVSAILQGFVPGLVLKLLTLVAPSILMVMAKFEGHLSRSILDRVAAAKFYYFLVISVCFANVLTGSLAYQLADIVDGQSISAYVLISFPLPRFLCQSTVDVKKIGLRLFSVTFGRSFLSDL